MVTKNPTEEAPARKRISIPQADESVLQWWERQADPSLSVRMIIRGEIERNGYQDVVYRPVDQLPKRGRPVIADDEPVQQPTAPAMPVEVAAVATPVEAPAPVPVEAKQPPAGQSAIDLIMNG